MAGETTSDEAVRKRTGRGWDEWFTLLDEWGATGREHAEIARWLAEEHKVGAWWAQSVAVAYERARGMRAVGEHADGFAASASKTVGVPVDGLYDGFIDDALRAEWLPDGELRDRTATRPKSARFDWGDGPSRVQAYFTAKGESKSSVAIEHARLPDAEAADQMKAYWRDRLGVLKQLLEKGGRDTSG